MAALSNSRTAPVPRPGLLRPSPLAEHGPALLRRAGRTPAQVLSTDDLLQLLGTRPKIEDAIERLIALLDAADVIEEDLEEEDLEDGADAEPSLGASELHMQFVNFWHDVPKVDRATSQGLWTEGCDGRDLENDPSLAEPYLSVCEWEGYGDNWGRSGNFTMGGQTDVEDVNGAEAQGREVAHV